MGTVFRMPTSPSELRPGRESVDEDDVKLCMLPFYEMRRAVLKVYPVVRDSILQNPRMRDYYPMFVERRGRTLEEDWVSPTGDIKFTWLVDKSVRHAMRDLPEAVMWVDYAMGLISQVMEVDGWRGKIGLHTTTDLRVLGVVVANLTTKFLLGETQPAWARQKETSVPKARFIEVEKRVLDMLEWRLFAVPTLYEKFRGLVYEEEMSDRFNDPTNWFCALPQDDIHGGTHSKRRTPHYMHEFLQKQTHVDAWLEMALSIDRITRGDWMDASAKRLLLLVQEYRDDDSFVETTVAHAMDVDAVTPAVDTTGPATEEEKVAALWCHEEM